MKLPISLLVLMALSQALSVPVAKRSEAKASVVKTTLAKTTEAKRTVSKISEAMSSEAKQNHNNQTSKRELLEGNFGERNKEVVSKHEVTGPPPKIVFAKELQEMISEHTPAHQMFGVRLPQIAKISDVLSGHGPSFEAAVASQLYSPVSVYQARHLSPTSFEVPTPSASQSGYSNSKSYQLRNAGRNEQKTQGDLPKSVKLPNPPAPLYKVDQPKLRFDSYSQSLDSELVRQHANLPHEIFRTQEVSRNHMPLVFPLYDQLGPFRYPGQFVPSQYLHRNGIFQIFPVARDYGKSTHEDNREKDYSGEENYEQIKGAIPKVQIEIPVLKQGYHAHPNGAISFARFTNNLHGSMQHDTAPQPQSKITHQPKLAQYQSQAIPVQLPPQIKPEFMSKSRDHKVVPLKQELPYPPMLQGFIQDLEKYQPVHQQTLQFNPFNKQIHRHPIKINALQQHLLLQEPRQSSNLQIIQLPPFKPLPQSLLESYSKKTSRAPIPSEQVPKLFNYSDHSDSSDRSLEEASTRLSSLPPLKPNYSKYVKPLETKTTPIFLPTPLQTLFTSTAKVNSASDQLISSTTIQPDVKGQENPKTQLIYGETESQSETPRPLDPEVFHQAQPTVHPQSVQSTTYLPFVTNEPHSIFFSQPKYQSTSRPIPQRHDVVIQQQEIQEIFLEPSRQPPSTTRFRNKQVAQLGYPLEQELHQLRTHPHYELFEQLLPYKQEYQDIHSPQQYIVEARESQQKPGSAQHTETQQYVIQQHSKPLQLQLFQQQLLQSQHPELEQQQQGLNQQQALETAQKQQRLNQEQQDSEQTHQQQLHEFEQTQQQQQAFEKAELQQAQQQKQESEQAQQQIQESERALQQQFQQNSLQSSNQIQISTLAAPQDIEKQTESVEIQTESQTELQPEFKLQSSTGKPDEQSAHLSEPTPHLQQPYLGGFLTQSVVPQLYAHQQLVAQPEHSPLLGIPSYSDVQYYGKFAETLFGNEKLRQKDGE